MKNLGSLALLTFVCLITIDAQTKSDKAGVLMESGADKYHADLQLTTSIVDQRYCSDGRLRFTLNFNFRNAAGETIILDKRSSIVPGYTISRSTKHAAAGRHKLVAHTLIGITGDLMTLSPIPDESQFTFLRPGESQSLDAEFSIGLDEKELPPGAYVLQLSVLTWHYPNASNIEWRNKWRQKGYLWTDSITSQPMAFTIEKDHPVAKCF